MPTISETAMKLAGRYKLTRLECVVLECLVLASARDRQAIVSTQELQNLIEVHGRNPASSYEALRSVVSRLRKKLKAKGLEITTHYGMGLSLGSSPKDEEVLSVATSLNHTPHQEKSDVMAA